MSSTNDPCYSSARKRMSRLVRKLDVNTNAPWFFLFFGGNLLQKKPGRQTQIVSTPKRTRDRWFLSCKLSLSIQAFEERDPVLLSEFRHFVFCYGHVEHSKQKNDHGQRHDDQENYQPGRNIHALFFFQNKHVIQDFFSP